MMLLFDNDLSPRLVAHLADAFGDASHVSLVGLERASDDEVSEYARLSGCVVVTEDADFGDLGASRGAPPKVIWPRVGNCTTQTFSELLPRHRDAIVSSAADPSDSVLVWPDRDHRPSQRAP
jgi:predicted nuclease of predicted toxin-antitoxin system